MKSPELLKNPDKVGKTLLLGAAAMGLGLAYQKYQRSKAPGENCFDIVSDLHERIRSVTDVPYFVAGGVSAAALMEEGTFFDVEHKLIIPPKDIFKAQYRKNGTMGDIDILALTSNVKELDAIRLALTPLDKYNPDEMRKPGAKLKIGVTGLATKSDEESFSTILKEGFVSDRVQHIHSDGQSEISWDIADLSVTLSEDCFEEWTLQLPNGGIVPVMHPVVQMICYGARTGHGLRKRDLEKEAKMAHVVGPAFGIRVGFMGDDRKLVIKKDDEDKYAPYDDALKFLNQKNHHLSYDALQARLGEPRAAFIVGKMALHRYVDTHDFFERFGQGGPIFDLVLTKITGERQQKIQ